MDELKLVTAGNLIALRQKAGLTQAGLGEKLNYSDKTVSKWERGESLPDAYVLTRLAALYGITVDELLRPADSWEDPLKRERKKRRSQERQFSASVVTLTALTGIWTMAVLMFVILWLVLDSVLWLIFVCAVPVSIITLLVFNSVFNHARGNVYIIMCLVASVVALVYLFFLPFNLWQLFLILIPAELLVYFASHVRHGLRRKP